MVTYMNLPDRSIASRAAKARIVERLGPSYPQNNQSQGTSRFLPTCGAENTGESKSLFPLGVALFDVIGPTDPPTLLSAKNQRPLPFVSGPMPFDVGHTVCSIELPAVLRGGQAKRRNANSKPNLTSKVITMVRVTGVGFKQAITMLR